MGIRIGGFRHEDSEEATKSGEVVFACTYVYTVTYDV